jgi:hypothetical protein
MVFSIGQTIQMVPMDSNVDADHYEFDRHANCHGKLYRLVPGVNLGIQFVAGTFRPPWSVAQFGHAGRFISGFMDAVPEHCTTGGRKPAGPKLDHVFPAAGIPAYRFLLDALVGD